MTKPTTPLLAADIVIEHPQPGDGRVLLIERRNEPAGWALPGGFVDVGESVESAAIREAREETGLDIELVCLLGVYSAPDRDPRGHSVSVTYVARAGGTLAAGNDAKGAQWADPAHPPPLAFDHDLILRDYLRWRLNQTRLPRV
jgi:8-oxo-dGTP diphosphatase